jgi:hypothetical protein
MTRTVAEQNHSLPDLKVKERKMKDVGLSMPF